MQTRTNQEELKKFLSLIPPQQQLKVQNEYFKKKILLNTMIIKLIEKNSKKSS